MRHKFCFLCCLSYQMIAYSFRYGYPHIAGRGSRYGLLRDVCAGFHIYRQWMELYNRTEVFFKTDRRRANGSLGPEETEEYLPQ